MNKTTTIALALLLFIIMPAHAQSEVKRGLQAIDRRRTEIQMEFLANNVLKGRTNTDFIITQLHNLGYRPRVKKYTAHGMKMRNVLLTIPGVDTTQCVIIGVHYNPWDVAHIDGIYKDMYRDIDKDLYDNSARVAGVLQVAAAIKASGAQPQRSIVLAFWDGEERRLMDFEHYKKCGIKTHIKSCIDFNILGHGHITHQRVYFCFYFDAVEQSKQGLNYYSHYMDLAIKEYDLKPFFPLFGRTIAEQLADPWNFNNDKCVGMIPVNWVAMIEHIRSAYVLGWYMANN